MAKKEKKNCCLQDSRCNTCGECGFIGVLDIPVAQAEDASLCPHGIREDRQCPECRDDYSRRFLQD